MVPIEKLTKATNIFNELIKNGEIDLNINNYVYEALLDDEISDILNTIANTSKLIIRRVDKLLYLLPSMDNEIYGYQEKEIKEKLFSGATKVDYYLFNYINLIILNKFYSSGGDNPKLLQHLSVNDLIKLVTTSLEAMCSEEVERAEEEYLINFNMLSDRWSGLLLTDETSKYSLKTKRGVLLRVFKFMQEEGLIKYFEDEDIILTTKRCDDLMKNFFLNYDRKEVINEFFEKEGGKFNAGNQ